MNKEVTDKKLWDKAYETVLKIRGSSDVPAFDYCVECEYRQLLEKEKGKK